MAIYTFNFHSPDSEVLASYEFDCWAGNRDLSNRRSIAVATTIYSYLAYRDSESLASMWLAIGNAGEAFIQSIENQIDWRQGAISVDYLLAGKTRTAVVTLNAALGARLSPLESLSMLDGGKAFNLAF